MAIDINCACTGFDYGLDMAKRYLQSEDGVDTVLLVATEELSKFVDYTDRSSCILFGDGAAAFVLERNKNTLWSSYLGADGNGAKFLVSRALKSENVFRTNKEEFDMGMPDTKEYFFAQDGKYYLGTADGLATGESWIDGDRCLFDEDGELCTGWFEIDGVKMYFDTETMHVYRERFADFDEETFYFDANGRAVNSIDDAVFTLGVVDQVMLHSMIMAEENLGNTYTTTLYLSYKEKLYAFNVTVGDSEATAISSIKAVTKSGAIYNIAGQQLAAPQRGLNIIGGKKVLVK
jgi:hypothetical protein